MISPDQLAAAGSLLSENDPGSDMQLRLLELRHRSKNMLAIVTALVNQTLQGERTLEAARGILTARLVAMSDALDVLVHGEIETACLSDLVRRSLTHFGDIGSRILVEGPEVVIGPNTALHLALAFHELGTNALKYGALSRSAGYVGIRWSVEGEDQPALRISWQEQSGPKVVEPTRKGFGSRLTSVLLSRRLDGAAQLDFAEQGFRWTFTAPLEAVKQ